MEPDRAEPRSQGCPAMIDLTIILSPGEITIERKPDGSVIITQANLFKLYDDEVTIPEDQFATVIKALQQINNEIIERETI